MKTPSYSHSILAAACALVVSATATFAQDSVVSSSSTVTTDGVVQQFEPTSSQIIVSSGSAAPVHYTYNKTTTFVDAAGNVVSQESIKQNTPARIYYTRVGDSYVVTKFVANPTVTTTSEVVAPAPAPAPVVEETTTTTTTTKK
ncbi:MAG: hypothetical protein ABIT76_06175 [Chthoniobacterales bacterium]